MHIFISYAKADTRDLALQLRDTFIALPGVTSWMDTSLYSGEDWATQIQDEIDRADLVIVLLSQDVNRPANHPNGRSFVLKEIHYAQQGKKTIIPVMAQTTRVPVQLAGIEYINFTRDQSSGIQRLIREITTRAGVAEPINLPPVAPSTSIPLPFPPVPARLIAKPSQTIVSPTKLTRYRRPAFVIGFIALVLIIIIAVVLPSLNSPTLPTPTTNTSLIPSNSPPPILATITPTLSPTDTPKPTATSLPTLTSTRVPPTATFTSSPTLTLTPVPLGAPGNPVNHNTDWIPISQIFNGVEMVLVPVGCFMMGSNDTLEGEKPMTQQCIKTPYWIDKTEVTNKQYGSEGQFKGDTHPRDSVTWAEARDFCAKRGDNVRLPTELEWEYAARGPDNLVYPWGNDFVADNVVYGQNYDIGSSTEVGSKPAGHSWVGALDLSGNLSEWMTTIYAVTNDDNSKFVSIFAYPYNSDDGRENLVSDDKTFLRVLRGGSWFGNDSDVRASFRSGGIPSAVINGFGFRCVRSISPQDEVVSNTDWTPHYQTFNGYDMAQVPAGCFLMGSADHPNGVPVSYEQCVDPFWIDKYEVTNKQYGSEGEFKGDNRPRDSVTWLEARDFCLQRGARLPTEPEWEYAARGPSNLVFPWGNDFVAANVIYLANSNSQSVDVGSRPANKSWVGAYDMSGNLWEWVSTIFKDYPYDANDGRESANDNSLGVKRVLRGGAWKSIEDYMRSANRGLAEPSIVHSDVGFRCARSQ